MQRVLITAGASGIGREIARAFSAAGAKVAVVDIDRSDIECSVPPPPFPKSHVRILT